MSRARKKKAEMSGNSLGVLSSGALAGAERSEGERSEPQRSAAAANAVPASRQDPEVVAKAKRRTFTAEYSSAKSARQRCLPAPHVAGARRAADGRNSPVLLLRPPAYAPEDGPPGPFVQRRLRSPAADPTVGSPLRKRADNVDRPVSSLRPRSPPG